MHKISHQKAPTFNNSQDILSETLAIYRNPSFLKSQHGAPKLIADFGGGERLEVNFDIELDDGSSLASNSNDRLRSDIYDLVCLQVLPYQGRKHPAATTIRQRVIKILNIVDYLILNHCSSIRKFGLASVTGNDLIGLIRTIAFSNMVVDQIYDWNRIFANFLIRGGASVSLKSYKAAVRAEPTIPAVGNFIKESELGLTKNQLKRARAYLFIEKLYSSQRREGLWIPNTAVISRLLYRNTLINSATTHTKKYSEELVIGERAEATRELEAVNVRTTSEDPRCSKQRLTSYTSVLLTAKRLIPFDIGISREALKLVEAYDPSKTIALKELGHTNPAPAKHVIWSLGQAIAFFYNHAAHLLDSHAAVLIAARQKNLDPAYLEASTGINYLLNPESVSYGVTNWSLITKEMSFMPSRRPVNFHATLRKTKSGLCELVKVAYGSMLLITGVLSAGRQGELGDLVETSFDETENWLELSSRKSGHGNIRRKDLRPVPQVVIDVLSLIDSYKTKLKKEGIYIPTELFAVPSFHGKFSAWPHSLNIALDVFFDFIEMPCDENGKRYYLRQHQLRQFFIIAFFYAGGIGGFDTIRWFVRHYDPEQLWAYLQQSVPGKIMMRYKALTVKSMLCNDAPEVGDLHLFLRSQLGVKRLSIMTDSELILYLEDLQDMGAISIEPLFYKDEGGSAWRLGVKIFGECHGG